MLSPELVRSVARARGPPRSLKLMARARAKAMAIAWTRAWRKARTRGKARAMVRARARVRAKDRARCWDMARARALSNEDSPACVFWKCTHAPIIEGE